VQHAVGNPTELLLESARAVQIAQEVLTKPTEVPSVIAVMETHLRVSKVANEPEACCFKVLEQIVTLYRKLEGLDHAQTASFASHLCHYSTQL